MNALETAFPKITGDRHVASLRAQRAVTALNLPFSDKGFLSLSGALLQNKDVLLPPKMSKRKRKAFRKGQMHPMQCFSSDLNAEDDLAGEG